ncbi:uncharacterized protein LOC131848646 [Achroia grisella]|uniref:uncharacterized protein LOC131848646 n=1 Tax=Achroia grisella TaxID=688607 RepID=UPI0027D2D6E5|nr:uncharacterized protein LOC131848646 [Achroia grisella]
MFKDLSLVVLGIAALVLGKEPELPPCPTNVEYFPQDLPMHCRMPRHANYPTYPENMLSGTMPPFPLSPPFPPVFPPPGPYFPAGKEGAPVPMPMSLAVPGPMSAMPVVAPGPAQKLPVIVMPFYSPDRSYQKSPRHHPPRRIVEIQTRRPFYSDTDISSDTGTDTDTSFDTSHDTSSDGGGWWKGKGWRRNGRRFNKRHKPRRKKHTKKDLLTPILQYVTKDGYVIFEKTITKNEAKDWLKVKKTTLNNVNKNEENEPDSNDDEDADEEQKAKNSKEGAVVLTTRIPKKHAQRKVNIMKKS